MTHTLDPRLLALSAPSGLVLVLLVVHSVKALPRSLAAGFWVGVTVYGFARGIALHWVTAKGLGAPYPYVIHRPLFSIFGVSFQEMIGWAIVAYLGWWLGDRFSPEALFPQILWGCLFLGSISWMIESAAVAAGWWHWTIPIGGSVLVNVPFIALVDWFFVGTDFLLPFLVFWSPSLRGRAIRFLSLAAFPLHFGSHCFVERLSETFPIPPYHLFHWLTLGILLWLAATSGVRGVNFGGTRVMAAIDSSPSGSPRRAADSRQTRRDAGTGSKPASATKLGRGLGAADWLPVVALAIVLADVAVVELFAIGNPTLLFSILPTASLTLVSLRPALGPAFLVVATLLGVLWRPSVAVGAVPPLAAGLLRWARRRQRWRPALLVAGLWVAATMTHARGAMRENELRRGLDDAIARRDRNDLEGSSAELQRLSDEFPSSHVPSSLLGEILYRSGRLEEAHKAYRAAVERKQDFLLGYQFLAVIDLQRNRATEAVSTTAMALEIAPGDRQLQYLHVRASRAPTEELWVEVVSSGGAEVELLASLAFEVGDTSGAIDVVDRGLKRWPSRAGLYRMRTRLAVEQRDNLKFNEIAAAWSRRFPADADAKEAARRAGLATEGNPGGPQ